MMVSRRLDPPGVPGSFAIRVRPDREVVHVEPAGELDLATVEPLRSRLQELVDAGFRHLVLDLRELVFIDVSGLRFLLDTHACGQRHGWRLSLIQAGEPIRHIFEITNTLHMLPFESPNSVAQGRH